MIYLFALIALVFAMYMFYLSRTDPAEYYWKMQSLQGAATGGAIVFVVYIAVVYLTGKY